MSFLQFLDIYGFSIQFSASINEFQDILSDYMPQLIQRSQQIGGLVENQTKLAGAAFDRQLEFIRTASISAKPSSDAQLMAMLKPMSDCITAAQVCANFEILFFFIILDFFSMILDRKLPNEIVTMNSSTICRRSLKASLLLVGLRFRRHLRHTSRKCRILHSFTLTKFLSTSDPRVLRVRNTSSGRRLGLPFLEHFRLMFVNIIQPVWFGLQDQRHPVQLADHRRRHHRQ